MIYICLLTCTPTEIIEHPTDTEVDLEKNATFTCKANGGDFTSWKINGTNDIPSEKHQDIYTDQVEVGDSNLLTLNITAKDGYDGTTVQCVAGDIGVDPEESDTATMTVRGIICVLCKYSCLYNNIKPTFFI